MSWDSSRKKPPKRPSFAILNPKGGPEMAPSSNLAPSFNFDLGETVDMLRQTVQAFAQNEIAPRAMEADKRAEFPHDLWRKFGALGLLGITAE